MVGWNDKVSLTRAQLHDGQRRIQILALREGTSWMVWSSARASLAAIGADELDLQNALIRFAVVDYEVWGGVVRFIGHGRDTEERYLEVNCMPHDEVMTIEVFSVRLI